MKTNILKKLFVKIIKSFGFEIIDQNQFKSPTLNRELNQQLSNQNKSIILPLGEVKLTRKISSLLIIFRTNSNIEIWDQNKKRIFEKDKIEYVKRSLTSLIKAIKNLKELKDSYTKYLENFFREKLNLGETPLSIRYKEQSNPFRNKPNTLTDRQIKKRKRIVKRRKK